MPIDPIVDIYIIYPILKVLSVIIVVLSGVYLFNEKIDFGFQKTSENYW